MNELARLLWQGSRKYSGERHLLGEILPGVRATFLPGMLFLAFSFRMHSNASHQLGLKTGAIFKTNFLLDEISYNVIPRFTSFRSPQDSPPALCARTKEFRKAPMWLRKSFHLPEAFFLSKSRRI